MAINIAIDGPCASGKSTVAEELCRILNYVHLDSGAMYRCVALAVLRGNVDFEDEKALRKLLKTLNIRLSADGKVYLNGEDVTDTIRTSDVAMMASNVSTKPFVREKLVKMQRDMAANKGFVMDGRDIGTVVLPDAELKIYLTASAEARAMRRYLENEERGIDSNLLELKQDIMNRDYQDMHRKASPLKKAEDAIEIDSSNLTKVEVVDTIMRLVTEVM